MTENERERLESEIRACKQLLDYSDYNMLKSIEKIIQCENITDLVRVIGELRTEFKEIVGKRAGWREYINDAEAQLAEADAEDATHADSVED